MTLSILKMGFIKLTIFFLVFLLGVVIWQSHDGLAYDNNECVECHNLQSSQSRLRIDTTEFNKSVHVDNVGCIDCHNQVKDEKHTLIVGSSSVDCTECHDQENRHGLNGTGDNNRPACFHCHTRHNILSISDPLSSIHPDHMETTCAQCHPSQCGQSGYLSWLPSIKLATHPKADLSSDYSLRNCLGCHQGQAAHGEEELLSDKKCFRCHLNTKRQNPLLGFIHPKADPARQVGVFASAIIYQIVILLLLVGIIFFFIRKFSGVQRP